MFTVQQNLDSVVARKNENISGLLILDAIPLSTITLEVKLIVFPVDLLYGNEPWWTFYSELKVTGDKQYTFRIPSEDPKHTTKPKTFQQDKMLVKADANGRLFIELNAGETLEAHTFISQTMFDQEKGMNETVPTYAYFSVGSFIKASYNKNSNINPITIDKSAELQNQQFKSIETIHEFNINAQPNSDAFLLLNLRLLPVPFPYQQETYTRNNWRLDLLLTIDNSDRQILLPSADDVFVHNQGCANKSLRLNTGNIGKINVRLSAGGNVNMFTGDTAKIDWANYKLTYLA
jgi:hypothetical protein